MVRDSAAVTMESLTGNQREEAPMPNGRNAERAECRILAVSNKTDEKLY